MILALMGIIIVIVLLYVSIVTLVPAPAKISQPVSAYDNQFEVFRDMEPSSQVRENPWVGFLQEDIKEGRTGPIGEFVGNESSAGKVRLYNF